MTNFPSSSRASPPSKTLPYKVVGPNRRCLRHSRNNRLERPIVVQLKRPPPHAVPHAVRSSRGFSASSLRFALTTRTEQSRDDHHGTFIPFYLQLYHLYKNHKAAGSAIPSPKRQVV